MPPQSLDFGFAILNVFFRDRIVFFLFHLVGLRTRIFPGHIVVTGAGAGDQLDLETGGFGHGVFLKSSRAVAGMPLARKLAPKRQMSRKALFSNVYSSSRKNCWSTMK